MFCFVWSNFLVRFFSLSSKFVFVTKFACANLSGNFSAVNLLNSGVVMYWSWLRSLIFFSILLIFALKLIFLTKLLTLDTLFSTAEWSVVVAKLLIFGSFPSTSFILALRVVLVAKLVKSGILSSIFFILFILHYI